MTIENSPPLVSIIVANYNCGRFLQSFLKQISKQSVRSFEIIVIDDASTDESVDIIRKVASHDPRIILIGLKKNSGPAVARNAGLARARGEWIAIVDSDDLMHYDRLQRLIDFAKCEQADIVADDLMMFYEDGRKPKSFLKGLRSRQTTTISLTDFICENSLLSSTPALGFLKPVFWREAIEKHKLRYDETLRIGEDYDFMLRALSCGLTYKIDPFPSYLYRKHSQSISHRLTNNDIVRMEKADAAFLATQRVDNFSQIEQAWNIRSHSLGTAQDWNDFVDAIKAKLVSKAFNIARSNIKVLYFLSKLVISKATQAVSKIIAPVRKVMKPPRTSICLISRQRLGDAVNGSSSYTLSIASYLKASGCNVHLLQPSPSIFGRQPLIIFKRQGRMFDSVTIRGAIKIGPLAIAITPAPYIGALRAVLSRLGTKIGITIADQPAPYSVAAPWTKADFQFIAEHARQKAGTIIVDYAFQTGAIPYVLQDEAQSLVLMHDLFSSRSKQFADLGKQDSVATLSTKREIEMLTQADCIVAIQDEEKRVIESHLLDHRVLSIPMAISAVSQAQIGKGGVVLFVGSNTAPNVIGLNWFLDEIWPSITNKNSKARLQIAGTVSRSCMSNRSDVTFLGMLPDLSAVYADAEIVVSPLTTGSGLKIKLIEALAHGKAVVATTPTIQGVGPFIQDAVLHTDSADEFTAHVLSLLEDQDLRLRYATAALQVAQDHFSVQATYQPLLDLILGDRKPTVKRTERLSIERIDTTRVPVFE